MNNLSLQSLNISIESWFSFEVNKVQYNIPLYIHIKDIYEQEEEIIPLKMDILRGDFRLNKTESPFFQKLLEHKLLTSMDEYLIFIDKRKLFTNEDGDKVSFLEYIDIDIRDILDEATFISLRDELIYYINYLKSEFIERCKILLDYDRDFPKHYKPKDNDMPQDVKDNIVYPIGMTMLQSDIEYPSNIIFEENVNKPVNQYSFREIQLKAMYLHMKNKIEGFLNSYQAYNMEKDRPNK